MQHLRSSLATWLIIVVTMIGSIVVTPAAQALQTNYRVWENFSISNSGESEFVPQTQQEQWGNALYNYDCSLDPKKFHTLDTYEGTTQEPKTLHKYLYVHGNPVSNIDPSGNITLTEITTNIVSLLSFASVAYPTTFAVGKTILGVAGLAAVLSDPYGAFNDFRDGVLAFGPIGGVQAVFASSVSRIKSIGKISRFFDFNLSKSDRLEEFVKVIAPQLRTKLNAGSRRTVALGQMELDGQIISVPAASGQGGSAVGAPLPGSPVFSPFPVPQGTAPRARDAEYKILEEFARILEGGASRPSNVTIWVDKAPCASCSSVISEFEKRYSVAVDVVSP